MGKKWIYKKNQNKSNIRERSATDRIMSRNAFLKFFCELY